MGIKNLFSRPFFWVAICLMICSGASELAMAQWASAYAEAALGLSKALGDLAGPCMFAEYNEGKLDKIAIFFMNLKNDIQ